jgi:quercetin dioxygenase-like cupin family protein
MSRRNRNSFVARWLSIVPFALALGAASAQQPPPAKATPLLTKPLVGLEGKEVAMLTVEYPPGGASAEHRHDANTFVYVLEGTVEMQVAGGELMRLTAGQTFYESPSDVHSVSRNASATQPAKFLVLFVRDAAPPAPPPR